MKLRIEQDPNPPSPREARRNQGQIIHWHARPDLGERVADREAARAAMPSGSVIVPVSLFNHSCVRLWAGVLPHWSDPDGGDSGHVGYIFATPDGIAKYFVGGDPADQQLRSKVRSCLRHQIREFDQFLRRDVWRYVIEDENGKQLDACGDLYGREFAECAGQMAMDRVRENQLNNLLGPALSERLRSVRASDPLKQPVTHQEELDQWLKSQAARAGLL